MSADVIIEDLRSRGVSISANGDKLKISGPKLTEEEKDLVRQFKPEILAILGGPPPEETLGESDVWDIRLPCQAAEKDTANETERKTFSATERIKDDTFTIQVTTQRPTRAELEEIAARMDDVLETSIEQLCYIRDNKWYDICECRTFEAWVNKYLKKSGRSVRYMMQAQQIRSSLSPEAARIFRGAPDSHLRAISAVAPEKQADVAYEAARIAAARPAPYGERAKFAPRDEDGNAVNKINLADIQAATITMTMPDAPAVQTRFDQELLGKVGMSGKPEMPTAPAEPPTSLNVLYDFAETEEEAKAIVCGEVLPLPVVRPDDLSTFIRPTPIEETATEQEEDEEEETEGPDIRILRCTPNVTKSTYYPDEGKIVLRVEFAKANFPVVIHIGKGE